MIGEHAVAAYLDVPEIIASMSLRKSRLSIRDRDVVRFDLLEPARTYASSRLRSSSIDQVFPRVMNRIRVDDHVLHDVVQQLEIGVRLVHGFALSLGLDEVQERAKLR